jgi:hypothetical protein
MKMRCLLKGPGAYCLWSNLVDINNAEKKGEYIEGLLVLPGQVLNGVQDNMRPRCRLTRHLTFLERITVFKVQYLKFNLLLRDIITPN